MDANGTRFCLLLGENDWSRARFEDESFTIGLGQAWSDRRKARQGSPAAAASLDWDAARAELTLRVEREKFAPPPADQPVGQQERRGVAGDRFGNIYWIDASRTRILVRSAGGSSVGEFWKGSLERPPQGHGDFSSAATPSIQAPRLGGLAVTQDHYLAAGTLEPPGLIVFDLMAGGPPVEIRWPDLAPAFCPVDIAPRPGCGLWILDGAKRYWALDRGFGVVSAGQPEVQLAPGEIDEFQPASGEEVRKRDAQFFPAGHALDAWSPALALDPIAIEALPGGEVLILDRGDAHLPSRVLCLRKGERLLGDARDGALDFRAHDFVFVPEVSAATRVGRLLITSDEGNQAFAFDIALERDEFHLIASTDFHPMRRFRGKGLVRVGDKPGKTQVFYDFAEGWVPLVRQHRARYGEGAVLVTPVFDSTEGQCIWHRLMLDACIPPEASVEVWSRAGDALDGPAGHPETSVVSASGWMREPNPYLRGRGCELPWSRARPGAPSADGSGTWELLFQKARGRYLQIKLVLQGDGRTTPRLRALRAWYPRYSFLEHYFPAVYREDAESASFLERFLANFEGLFTAIEDRIAAVQALFDVRSAPGDALDWLADWFGVAMDPAWDERRQRLFIRHAMDFFQYRGTVHGLKMALHLAFDPRIDERDLGPPGPERPGLENIRIVENYLLRAAPSVLFGAPAELSTGTTEAVPSGGAQERARWQRHLSAQYPDIAALNAAHGTSHPDFASLALPADEPERAPARQDWKTFITLTAGEAEALTRSRWQDFLAQRYRRIESLNARYLTHWSSFAWIPLPDRAPADDARDDWLQFEQRVLPMYSLAHTFRVLLPTPAAGIDPAAVRERIGLAQRIVDLEKPAHTTFDVRFFWAMFRIGDARLGSDTLLDEGSRAPQLFPDTELGRSFMGTSFVAGAGASKTEPGRMALVC